MAQDMFKRLRPLLESGAGFTQMTQDKAESMVKELVKMGEVRRKEASDLVESLVDQGRQATERLFEMVRAEVTKQMSRIAGQVDAMEGQMQELAAKLRNAPPAKKATAVAPAVKKAAAKAAVPAKKAAAKVAPAKKAAARKVVAATKAPARKVAAKKTPARKTGAKKAAGRTA